MVTVLDPPSSTPSTPSTTEPPRAASSSRDSRPYPVPPEEAFRDPDWQPGERLADGEDEEEQEWPLLDFIAADDLARLGRRLITVNERFAHLRSRQIEYRWRREGGTSKDGPVLGRTTKPTGLLRHFAGCEYVVALSADHHRDRMSTYRQIEACLFHELSHCIDNKDGAPALTGHEFTGFVAEVQVYGAWHSDLKQAEQVFRQLRFDLDDLGGMAGAR